MDVPLMSLSYYAVIVCAIAGLFLAAYIHYKKSLRDSFICPLGSNCARVVSSHFSKILNVPVELLGVVYYTVIAASYTIFLVFPATYSEAAVVVILSLTAVAFFFSLYLTAAQLFVLKELCTWCLTSALLSTLIFFLGLTLSAMTLRDLLLFTT